ncbi:hypothetical protein EG028_27195 [Chitinophaga barathri]|uniref:Uncharacterized protein n=1 Tax=Chitinophaga barathri TaxID=1647451 RepID=A0A3N4M9J8_9BACT|nr:hypothetical protein EG028_27195 [Chitinophaga barathri]
MDFGFLSNGKFNVVRLQCAEEKRLRVPSNAKGADETLIGYFNRYTSPFLKLPVMQEMEHVIGN